MTERPIVRQQTLEEEYRELLNKRYKFKVSEEGQVLFWGGEILKVKSDHLVVHDEKTDSPVDVYYRTILRKFPLGVTPERESDSGDAA